MIIPQEIGTKDCWNLLYGISGIEDYGFLRKGNCKYRVFNLTGNSYKILFFSHLKFPFHYFNKVFPAAEVIFAYIL